MQGREEKRKKKAFGCGREDKEVDMNTKYEQETGCNLSKFYNSLDLGNLSHEKNNTYKDEDRCIYTQNHNACNYQIKRKKRKGKREKNKNKQTSRGTFLAITPDNLRLPASM